MTTDNTKRTEPVYSIKQCLKCSAKTVIICMTYPGAGYINQCTRCNWSICTVE